MNMAVGFLFVIFLVATFAYLPALVLQARRIRYYRHEVQVERSRAALAQARINMFDLVMDGELDPRSATFTTFYPALTALMRMPDCYDQLLPKLAKNLEKVDGQKLDQIAEEAKSWSDDVRKAVVLSADAMVTVLYQHSWLMRVATRLIKLHAFSLSLRKYLLPPKDREAANAAEYTQRTCHELAGQCVAH